MFHGMAVNDVADEWVELADDVALEAADDLVLGLSVSGSTGDVLARCWVVGLAPGSWTRGVMVMRRSGA